MSARRVIDPDAFLETGAGRVWIRTPLGLALARNRQRRADRRVPEASIRSVDRLFEPPTPDEGSTTVRVLEA